MSEKNIFDYLDEQPKQGEEGFFEFAGELPEAKDNSFFDIVADYGKTAIKGLAEGAVELGRMMGPLGKPPEDIIDNEKPKKELELTEALDTYLPTDEGFGQSSLRRGLKQAPSMAAFPGSSIGSALTRSVAAGFAGEGAKELGAPEWAQSAAELTAFVGPDLMKKLILKGSNKELIEAARRFGLSDADITPLIQSDFKKKWLSNLAPSRGKTEKVLSATKEKLGSAYDILKKTPEALTELPNEAQTKFFNKISSIALEDLPASMRKIVAQDFVDLTKNPITGKSLINLYKKINKNLGPKTKEFSLFKEPIREAIAEISPQLGKDFNVINDLYSRYSKIASKLKPTLVSDIVRAVETMGMLGSVVMANPVGIKAIVAEKGIRIGARELLLNPRLQQLGEKFLMALNQNKFGIASKITKDISDYTKKLDDKFEVENFSEEELKELFGN